MADVKKKFTILKYRKVVGNIYIFKIYRGGLYKKSHI